MERAASRVAPIALIAGFGLFLAVIGYAIYSAFARPEVVAFDVSPISAHPPADTLVVDTLTVDARDASQWIFVNLARRSVVVPPDTTGWTLALRRFDIIPAGAAADLGPVDFDSVLAIPTDSLIPTRFARDTVSPSLDRWYQYSFTTHVMNPNGHVYGIETRDRRYAKLEILSYYCPGVVAGCVTFRYAYQPSGAASFLPDMSP